MKKYTLLSIAFIAIASSCFKSNPPRMFSAPEALGQARNDFAVIIDIREGNEIEKIAEPAVWIPESKIIQNSDKWKKFLKNTSKNKTLIFYANNSKQALKICILAGKKGFNTGYIKNWSEWINEKLPVKTFKINGAR
ncbi:MAG: rhodanese-like domain-containing protein [Bacteriovoracaceae bacterium]|nr:rhodanese-like domain-containing protein [Bacteriovoracaceae bacterium]